MCRMVGWRLEFRTVGRRPRDAPAPTPRKAGSRWVIDRGHTTSRKTQRSRDRYFNAASPADYRGIPRKRVPRENSHVFSHCISDNDLCKRDGQRSLRPTLCECLGPEPVVEIASVCEVPLREKAVRVFRDERLATADIVL